MSKAKPFRDVQAGNFFWDIDGTLFIKIAQKVYTAADGSEIANCMILIPNRQKDDRGDMRKKEVDTYCEVLDEVEVGEIHLIEDAKTADEGST